MIQMENKTFPYNIFLIGFMGAGKSRVAREMKTCWGMNHVETDQMIVQQQGRSINQIFQEDGEAYFRKLETELLIALQQQKQTVVSCGGGMAMREENVQHMKQNGRVVLLSAKPETIYERVKDSQDRPLLNGNMNVDYIRELMEKRRPKYEAAADLVVVTDGKTVPEICEEIVEKLLVLEQG